MERFRPAILVGVVLLAVLFGLSAALGWLK
jgi:hypothetical protein